MDNIISYSPCKSVNIALSGHKPIKLTKGTKTLKALGKLAKALELDKDFEEFRLEHSRLLNQRKLKGTLCLSIHPLDYLTMSDNASGWSSCMSWQEDGCYRMGTVEMMNSPMAVVAYMKGSNDLQWDTYTWNNKKWRTLILVNPESIVSIKAYPYKHDEFTTICIDWLRELVTTNLGWDMHQDIQRVEEGTLFSYHGNEYSLSPHTRKMYNDFGAVTHLITLPKTAKKKLTIPLTYCYSGESECMCCGSTEALWDEENFVFCTNCSDGGNYYKECAECGESTSESEIYWVDDTPVCCHCLDNVAEECQFSGDYHYSENMCTIYLTRQNDVVDVDNNASIRVAKSYLEYCHISEIYCLPHQSANGEWYWNIEDMNFYGLKWYFNILDIENYAVKQEDENN